MSPTTTSTTDSNLQAALDLASRGVPVFPLGQDKIPRVRDWQARGTTDSDTIRRWWTRWPDAMPGLATGVTTGLAVLDLDRKDGKDGVALLRAMGLDPDTMSPVMVRTPSGGLHVYLQHHDGLRSTAGKIGEGVDTRAEGGLVVGPGAVNGKGTYKLLGSPLGTPLPAWPQALPVPTRGPQEAGEAQPTGLPLRVILDALTALDNTGDAYASRGDWLPIGMALHAETGGSEEGREAWHGWSRQHPTYDPEHTDGRWDSFKADRKGGVTAWTIVALAERRGWHNPAVAEVRRIEESELHHRLLDDLAADRERDWLLGLIPDDLYLPTLPQPKPQASTTSRLTFLTPDDCMDLPVRPYVIKGLLAQGDVGAIVSAPGVGKSLLAPRLGYAVAQGQPVFGLKARQGGVLYIAAEDGHGMRGRIKALRSDLGKADDFKLVVGVADLLNKSGELQELREAVERMRPALIIIDTLAVAFPGLEENEAKGMGQVVAAARSLTTWGAAVILIHHDTKAGDGLPRGHSLLNGALDVSLFLQKDKATGIVAGSLSKNRNGTSDQRIAFTIGSRVVGTDEDGGEATAGICQEAVAGSADTKANEKNRPTRQQGVALAILAKLTVGKGSVPKEDWRKACQSDPAFSASDDLNGKSKMFLRAVEGLSAKGHVANEGDLFTVSTFGRGDFSDDLDAL